MKNLGQFRLTQESVGSLVRRVSVKHQLWNRCCRGGGGGGAGRDDEKEDPFENFLVIQLLFPLFIERYANCPACFSIFKE